MIKFKQQKWGGRRRWLLVAVVGVILVAAGYYFIIAPVKYVDQDTTFVGDYTVKAGHSLIVSNGAVLTVEGNLIVDGTLGCEDGALTVVVAGSLQVNSKLKCWRTSVDTAAGHTGRAIGLVVAQSVAFAPEAVVEADGHVQIVNKSELLAESIDQVTDLYNGIGEPETYEEDSDVKGLVTTGQAGGGKVLAINGTWNLDGLDQGVVDNPVTDFSVPGWKITFDGLLILADGEDGEEVTGGCDLNVPEQEDEKNKKRDPRDAGRMTARAAEIVIGQLDLALGRGGDGSDAITDEDCDPLGKAKAGHGGQSGRFRIESTDQPVEIIGPFNVYPGRGGHGGTATAGGGFGASDCPGRKGGDATAIGGRGAHNRRAFALIPAAEGIKNIFFSNIVAGNGGDAVADPGDGGSGRDCECPGGQVGEAKTTAGRGGDARLTIPAGAQQIPGAEVTDGEKGEANKVSAKAGSPGPACGEGDESGADSDNSVSSGEVTLGFANLTLGYDDWLHLPYGHQAGFNMVADNDSVYLKALLPIKVEMEVSGQVEWEGVLDGKKRSRCDTYSHCTVRGPEIPCSYMQENVVIRAVDKRGNLLVEEALPIPTGTLLSGSVNDPCPF